MMFKQTTAAQAQMQDRSEVVANRSGPIGSAVSGLIEDVASLRTADFALRPDMVGLNVRFDRADAPVVHIADQRAFCLHELL